MCYLAQLTLHGRGVFGFQAIEDGLNEMMMVIRGSILRNRML
jgi:hypothetical protein